jgi:hypothetical protein
METSVLVIDKHYRQVTRGQAERARERLNRRHSISREDADKEAGR